MDLRWVGSLGMLVVIVACGGGEAGTEQAGAGEPTSQAAAPEVALETPACSPSPMPLEGRASPYDSTLVDLGGVQAKVCYGRPSARDREIFGGLLPYGQLWRTGANEPTIIHLPVAAEIAGLAVEPGSYSLYTIPGEDEWTVIVNRSTSQWGIETEYTEEIQAQEVGRATVPSETTDSHVETFEIAAEPAGANAANLVLSWERTRVRIPVRRG